MKLIKLFLFLNGTIFITNLFAAAPVHRGKHGVIMNSITNNINGPTVQSTSDGTKIINNPDGSSVRIYPDGTLFVVNSDGSTIQKNPDGSETSQSN